MLRMYGNRFIYFVEYEVDRTKCVLREELLFTFPVISLMSSASKSVKGAATDLLILLERLLVQLLRAPRIEPATEGKFLPISSPGSIVYRLLQRLWLQVYYYYDYYFLNVKYGIFLLFKVCWSCNG